MQDSDDLSLVAIWNHLRDRWTVIAGVTGTSIVIAVVVALWMTPIYRAEIVVVDVSDSARSGRSGALLSQFAGLASMAGADLSALGGTSRQSKAILRSRMLVEEFVRSNDLLQELLQDQWDNTLGEWTTENREAPSIWWAVKAFSENVRKVQEDPVSGTTRISMEWTDPNTAAAWANDYVALANEIIRTKDLTRSRENIAYLREQIEATTVLQHQQLLYNLLEKELQTEMLANARVEYAFAVVDPAVPPELRARPHRTLIVIIGAALGGLLGVLIVVLLVAIDFQRSMRTDR